MRQTIKFAVLAVLAAIACTAPAEARRGGRFPIAIPGLGGGESIVKVHDLPDRAPFIDEDGKFIDLGYLFKRHGKGEWIGYVGSSTRYKQIKPEAIAELLEEAGLSELPPVPERPASWGWAFWAAIAALIVFGKLKSYLGGRSANPAAPPATATAAPAPRRAAAEPEWTRRAAQSLQSAPAARTVRTARNVQPSVQPVGARAGFGRR